MEGNEIEYVSDVNIAFKLVNVDSDEDDIEVGYSL
jgi:hypothetical protein